MAVNCKGIVTRLAMIGMTAIVGTATLLSSPAWALNKTATVNVSVTIFAAPPCVINGNNTINVNFGDTVLTSDINGTNYMQPVNYTLDCTSAASNALKLSIIGNGANFDTSLLKTSHSALGIKLIRNGLAFPLNTASNFTYPNVPVLQAVPIKQTNATLSTGYFSGTATLVVEYQ
ncbi:fimbrial protein [Yersinia proxima]|uniref:Fimbrial protein n=1 Tax=Yersinia proxima TaxID=2890316 RepID=A0ABW9F3S0_9GAMM|nr:fimbrial protein [Yersinia proxima]